MTRCESKVYITYLELLKKKIDMNLKYVDIILIYYWQGQKPVELHSVYYVKPWYFWDIIKEDRRNVTEKNYSSRWRRVSSSGVCTSRSTIFVRPIAYIYIQYNTYYYLCVCVYTHLVYINYKCQLNKPRILLFRFVSINKTFHWNSHIRTSRNIYK